MGLIRGRYEPAEVVGRGGQGEVVRALDHQHERPVALKIRRFDSEAERDELFREARTLLALDPHSNLPMFREDFVEGDRYYLVSDWVQGTSLDRVLIDRGDPGLPAPTVLGYLEQAASALDHLHAHEPPIVHRDVKPANLILTPRGRVILVDFGIAARPGGIGDRTGTPGFAAPEIAQGSPVTPAADVYGLAATAFALLTGSAPAGLRPEWEGLPPGGIGPIERGVRRGLSYDPDRRPASASELVARLGAWLDSALPEGVVSFLATDIEGSARLWETDPAEMASAAALYEEIVATAVEDRGGRLIRSRGESDGALAVFAHVPDAIACALDLQRSIKHSPIAGRVRVAVHAGEAARRGADYAGPVVHRSGALRAAAHGGQILVSRAAADLATDHLPIGASMRSLGSHALADSARSEEIFQLCHPNVPAEFPPLRSTSRGRHNLPGQLTSLIGRESETTELVGLLEDNRLVTLTGPGGCGKTRLGLRVAEEWIGRAADGVWLAELATITDPALVPHKVAHALGLREEAGRSFSDTIADHLRDRDTLVMLDNCEHVRIACTELATTLLAACQRIRVLATSREPLAITGELTWTVPTLSVPPADRAATPVALSASVAGRLFAERAAQARSGFVIDDSNAEAVAQVCRRLDGIPLAIELAAGRIRMMTAAEIAERLSDRFALLASRSATALPRQQTLRATIDWSYDLLDEIERRLFARLAVFAGGCSLAAAEAVCAIEESGEAVFDGLAQIVDRSLIGVEERGGQTRYLMLESIREYALEKLAHEIDAVRAMHLSWCMHLAEELEPALYGPQQVSTLEQLDTEHDNARAALAWGIRSDPAAALRLAAALGRFWEVRGHVAEGRRWLDESLRAGAGGDSVVRARALIGLGNLLRQHGHYPEARERYEEARKVAQADGNIAGVADATGRLAVLALRRGDLDEAETLGGEALKMAKSAGDRRLIGLASFQLGMAAHDHGNFELAAQRYEESLALAREAGDVRGIAAALNSMGIAAKDRGDLGKARALYDESLEIARSLKDRYATGAVLINLGEIAQRSGDLAGARSRYEEALVMKRDIGDTLGIAACLDDLGSIAVAGEDWDQAARLAREALAIKRSLGDKRGIAESLEVLAKATSGSASLLEAAELFGAAEALRSSIGSPITPAEKAAYDEVLEKVRTQAGAQFDAAYAEGFESPLEEVLEKILRHSDPA